MMYGHSAAFLDHYVKRVPEWCGTGELPLPDDIQRSGIRSRETQEHNPDGIWRKDPVDLLASMGVVKPKEARKAEMVHLGEGLSPLPKE